MASKEYYFFCKIVLKTQLIIDSTDLLETFLNLNINKIINKKDL